MPKSRGYDSTAACSSRCRSGAGTPARCGSPRRRRCRRVRTTATAVPGCGRRAGARTCSRMRVPSMTGSSPWWSSHPARLASCWCSRPQAMATGGAVPGRRGGGGHRRGGPGLRVREPERGAVPGRAAVRAGLAGRGGEVHHPVAAQPAAAPPRAGPGQQPGQPGQVVAGVEDDQDVRVAVVPVPGGDDPRARPRGPARRSPRSRHRRGRAGPRPAAASTRCGPAPARR